MCDSISCGTQSESPLPQVNPEQRRLFLKGLASLPLASVLAFPDLARAAAGKLETVSIALEDGTQVSAALALPSAAQAPTVILIHEWWGLNDQIKAVAAELAKQGYVALAVDLYDGKVASNRAGAKTLMQAVDSAQATQTLSAWNQWLRAHPRSTGTVGTVGWCFGGGWSLKTSVATSVDATVVYYGNVLVPADELRALQGPVLGHFGTEDARINAQMVGEFEAAMDAAGKRSSLTVHWYEADHAFANPTGSRYDAEDAALSWDRTLAFLQQHLR